MATAVFGLFPLAGAPVIIQQFPPPPATADRSTVVHTAEAEGRFRERYAFEPEQAKKVPGSLVRGSGAGATVPIRGPAGTGGSGNFTQLEGAKAGSIVPKSLQVALLVIATACPGAVKT